MLEASDKEIILLCKERKVVDMTFKKKNGRNRKSPLSKTPKKKKIICDDGDV
jgi:hypothetical protein